MYGLSDGAMLDMGDFAGGMLKYLKRNPVPRLTIGGGFGKLAKLARGYLDLHSGRSQVDFDWLGRQIEEVGAPPEICQKVKGANTANEVLGLARAGNLPLPDCIALLARETALKVLEGVTIQIEVLIFDREGALAGRSGPA